MEQPLSAEEVAARLGVNEQTVRKWLRDGVLVGKPLPGRMGWRVSESAVIEFLRKRDPRLERIAAVLGEKGLRQRTDELRTYASEEGWSLNVATNDKRWPREWTAEISVEHALGQSSQSVAVDHVTEVDAIADAIAMAIKDVDERRALGKPTQARSAEQ